jgi:hypothetical protein
MLSLRILAFILCSAIRRSRALSCSAFQCFPDTTKAMIIDKNMLGSVTSSKTQRSMCNLLRAVYTFGRCPAPVKIKVMFARHHNNDRMVYLFIVVHNLAD